MSEENKINETPQELPAPEKQELLEAPEDVKPEEAKEPETSEKEASQEAKDAAVDEMEKASQKALDAMREQNNEKNEEVVDDAQEKLEDIFDEFRDWMDENTQPDKVKANMKDLADKVSALLESTRSSVIEVSQSEQFRHTMESGKEFLIGTGGMIADGLKYGADKLMTIPEVKKAADYASTQVDKLRENGTLKEIVERSEKGLSEFNEHLFAGLKSFFDAKPEKKDDLPDLPEQDDSSKE